MAKKPKAIRQDHNEAEILEIIKSTTDENIQLARQRKSINDKITANLSNLKAFNIDMTAYKAAAKRYEMDSDVRAEFDRSITQVNLALGIPVQQSLFGDDDGEPSDIPSAA